MKKLILFNLIVLFSLTSCGDLVDNIEVSTVSTGVDIGAKRVKIDTSENLSEKTLSEARILEEKEKKNDILADIKDGPIIDLTTTTESLPPITSQEEILTESEILEQSKVESVIIKSEIENTLAEDLYEDAIEPTASSNDIESIDLDLTQLNKNMLYSQLYNIMMNPLDYLGKSIRIEGLYISDLATDTGKSYHFVVITDEAACCQQGMEFKIDEGLNYPEPNTSIVIEGIFASYMEEGQQWYYLQVSNIN